MDGHVAWSRVGLRLAHDNAVFRLHAHVCMRAVWPARARWFYVKLGLFWGVFEASRSLWGASLPQRPWLLHPRRARTRVRTVFFPRRLLLGRSPSSNLRYGAFRYAAGSGPQRSARLHARCRHANRRPQELRHLR